MFVQADIHESPLYRYFHEYLSAVNAKLTKIIVPEINGAHYEDRITSRQKQTGRMLFDINMYKKVYPKM
jgi:hypothetical protein